MVNKKTSLILSKVPTVEKKVRSTALVLQNSQPKKIKKFRSREPYIPSVLTKNTNSSQIKSQYTICNIMPQLWKMETIIPDDCVIQYSHPGNVPLLTALLIALSPCLSLPLSLLFSTGFFFEEWLKVEIAKNDELRKEKKKAKEERRKLREEKRKKRREEEEKQVELLSSSPLGVQ
jgi:hypothetical protein